MSSLNYKSAQELSRLIRTKEISPLELMEETIKKIEATNPVLNAFVSVHAEQAMNEARTMTDRIVSGEDPGPLAGIPIGAKDLEDVQGMVTSFGSTLYKNNLSQNDSTQIQRLKTAGAIVLGKTNTPEFGFTIFTKNRLHGVTRNPWNTERTPGGSSGGSAVAVTAGMVPLATGSDAGGSIRIPAAYTGCFGLKTSFGRIPMDNFPGPLQLLLMHPIPVLGPLTRQVEDAALFLDCVAGDHPCDPGSLPRPERSFVECLNKIPTGLKIAYSPTLGYVRVQKEIKLGVEKAARCFEEMGHTVELWEETLPDVVKSWSKLINCDFFAQMQQILEKNSPELGRSLVMLLNESRSFSFKDHLEAQKLKTELNRVLWQLFDRFDLLLTPTMPNEAFDAGGPPPLEIDGESISLLGLLGFTYPFNFSGNPAASVPAGFTKNGLPVGLQIIGPRLRDDLVLQAAYSFQQRMPWNDSRPKIP